MMSMVTGAAVVAMFVVLGVDAEKYRGPGDGPWEFSTPEDEGLSSELIELSELEINEMVGGRECYIVVKNGKIVYEKYRRGRTESKSTELYSHTKSYSSSVFGRAVTKGYTSQYNTIEREVPDTLQCNPKATWENVLTMTGQSPNIDRPVFEYDGSGTMCLNTLGDFVSWNNPEGDWSPAWMEENWKKPLGLEHTTWGRGQQLPCGGGCKSSCRDAARVGLLWANEGYWEGYGQFLTKEYAKRAQTWIFPNAEGSWGEYGYLLWLWVTDDVDPTYSSMNGANGQCTSISREHNAVTVSFGKDTGPDAGWPCNAAWQFGKYALVSRDHPKFNMSKAASEQYRAQSSWAQTERAKQSQKKAPCRDGGSSPVRGEQHGCLLQRRARDHQHALCTRGTPISALKFPVRLGFATRRIQTMMQSAPPSRPSCP
mmetsp:Transcript_26546/g.79748  ORF Transcript_26546/g.79748 Transcript_26546/m.79748 type:complete len:427 (-) Transcript_26546:82-1362(-)